MSKMRYNPDSDIPDLSGKVILVTGGTSGISKETIRYLLPRGPAHIIFTGPNQNAARTFISESSIAYRRVRLSFIFCDQGSLASVYKATEKVLARVSRLDLLLCIAGTMANPPALSPDGYEIQFATNHLGHALLIKQLLPLLRMTAKNIDSDVRIVITASHGSTPSLATSKGIHFHRLKTPQSMFLGPWRRYGQSKFANLLYARALSKLNPQLKIVSVHPGMAFTNSKRNLGPLDKLFLKATAAAKARPQHELAWNVIWAATSSREGLKSGSYYEPVGKLANLKKGNWNRDEGLEERLWAWTETELKRWGVKEEGRWR